jgi:Ni,Fe-hydrogenase III large subunit
MSVAPPSLATLANGQAMALAALPTLPFAELERALLTAVAARQRVVAWFGVPTPDPGRTHLYAVLADDQENLLHAARTEVDGDAFPSLTPQCPQVHLCEREIAEQCGLTPLGHPWLKPVRHHRSWTGRDAWARPAGQPIQPGGGDFFQVEGEEVHEVAVGPVHAGIIEPGHFRFQCHGEEVFHLEISLGYQHRGIEAAMRGGPTPRSLPYAETLAGDSTIAHATCHCQVREALSRCAPGARAQVLRGIGLELERLANHVGDLGALAADIGFLPTASFCGRIRGDFLNLTALLCGNRFGRGLVRPGGVGFDVDAARIDELHRRLCLFEKDATVAISLLWDSPSVMARFEGIGPLPSHLARELGMVGPAARASGLDRDVRRDQPAGIYRFAHLPVATQASGDVFARAYVRWLEIQQSIGFIRSQLRAMPAGSVGTSPQALAPESLAVALVEGWRGEVCHVALTDADGRFARYKIVDPSFHNWPGLAMALRNQQISDFPICNKSFNLSYCGHDL